MFRIRFALHQCRPGPRSTALSKVQQPSHTKHRPEFHDGAPLETSQRPRLHPSNRIFSFLLLVSFPLTCANHSKTICTARLLRKNSKWKSKPNTLEPCLTDSGQPLTTNPYLVCPWAPRSRKKECSEIHVFSKVLSESQHTRSTATSEENCRAHREWSRTLTTQRSLHPVQSCCLCTACGLPFWALGCHSPPVQQRGMRHVARDACLRQKPQKPERRQKS